MLLNIVGYCRLCKSSAEANSELIWIYMLRVTYPQDMPKEINDSDYVNDE